MVRVWLTILPRHVRLFFVNIIICVFVMQGLDPDFLFTVVVLQLCVVVYVQRWFVDLSIGFMTVNHHIYYLENNQNHVIDSCTYKDNDVEVGDEGS